MPEYIDVDLLPDSEPDIEFLGFARKVMQSAHLNELDKNGVVYLGFNSSSKGTKREREQKLPKTLANCSSPRPDAQGVEVIVLDGDSDEEEPPSKRAKLSESRSASVAQSSSKRSTSTLIGQSECTTNVALSRSKSVGKLAERDGEEEFANYIAALDLHHTPNWAKGKENPQNADLESNSDPSRTEKKVVAAAARVAEDMLARRLSSTSRLQSQSDVFDWGGDAPSSSPSHSFVKIRQVIRSTDIHKRSAAFRQHARDLCSMRELHIAPSHITTIIQNGHFLAVASAVENGALHDAPGPYNKEGSLSVSDQLRDFVLTEHSICGEGRPSRHFTVNDVAIDPACPTRLSSVGRDRKLCIWDCEPMEQGETPKLLRKVKCKDNPEVIKYHSQGTLLAIQADDGCVYFSRDGPIKQARFTVASHQLRHFTAEMAWGVGPTVNILFASSASACIEGSSGLHKAYDVVKDKTVMEFDADNKACSALALAPSGEDLFIVTVDSESSYTLRLYNVRHGSNNRKADQQVVLKPFANGQDADINTLSISSDGLYIAAGRSDNWLDVYDARMLQRGPLYTFAHEGEPRRDTYGVVKAQWVQNQVYGSGLVSGGLDGCIRLWDVKHASDDPRNGRVLAQCAYDVSTFALGDIHKREVPIIVGERSGQVTLFDYASHT